MNVGMAEHITQTFSAFKLGGVRKIVGEGGVGVAVELEGHTAETLEYFVNEKTCTAVCRIERNADLLGTHMDSGNDIIDISIADVDLFVSAVAFALCGLIEKLCHFDDIVGLEGLGIAVCEFEAGPTVGVVARRDHNGAFAFEVILCEIGQRRKRKTDEINVDAFFTKRLDGSFRKGGGAVAAVIADDGAVDVSLLEILRVCFYDLVYVFGVEFFFGNSAADIVLTEHTAECKGVIGIMDHSRNLPF